MRMAQRAILFHVERHPSGASMLGVLWLPGHPPSFLLCRVGSGVVAGSSGSSGCFMQPGWASRGQDASPALK